MAERRDLGKAHGQWKVSGRWKVSLRRGKGSREAAASRETEGPGRLEPILRRRGQRRPNRAPRREGNGDDSYLDEHLHVHERLGQDGETGAQEHLTGRVRHDGTRGRTDRRSHQATEPVPDHVPGPPASLARRRRARTHGLARAAPPRPRPPPRPEKRQALASLLRGRGGAYGLKAHAFRRDLRPPLGTAVSVALAQAEAPGRRRMGVATGECDPDG